MSSSSGRAQTEPLAALVAVFALGVGLSLYAGALDATEPLRSTDRDLAPAATDRLTSEATSNGVVDPDLAPAATAARPAGYRLNASLRATPARWAVGPPVPRPAACVDRHVAVRVAPARIRAARLEVCVWPAR